MDAILGKTKISPKEGLKMEKVKVFIFSSNDNVEIIQKEINTWLAEITAGPDIITHRFVAIAPGKNMSDSSYYYTVTFFYRNPPS